MIELKVLSSEDAEQIRLWRNQCLEGLRTPFPLTYEQQQDWYESVVCNRAANARFFGIKTKTAVTMGFNSSTDKQGEGKLIGYTGLENISWENRNAEISLLINPAEHKKGYGREALKEIFNIGFNQLNLHMIYGECYTCNPAYNFWTIIINDYQGFCCWLPNRKYYGGKNHDIFYFSVDKDGYEKSLLYTGERRKPKSKK